MEICGMGRFATTAALYEQFRPPYSPEFFRAIVERLRLGKQHALIDLGTGPGLIALGFAPYVGRIVGVDPEPAMLEVAGRAAARAGHDLTLIESTAEALPREVGSFDVVTIGRALHWMDRDLVGSLLERLVAPGGVVLVCSARSASDGRNRWLEAYNDARRYWSGTTGRTHYRADIAAVFADTRFRTATKSTQCCKTSSSACCPSAAPDRSRKSSLRMRTLRSRLHSNASRRARWRFDSCPTSGPYSPETQVTGRTQDMGDNVVPIGLSMGARLNLPPHKPAGLHPAR
jgi:SAM-dependent methyltransferase